jgi:hypothetical protein
VKQERPSFFEKKEAKKLCSPSGRVAPPVPHRTGIKVFLLLFCSQKKKSLPS